MWWRCVGVQHFFYTFHSPTQLPYGIGCIRLLYYFGLTTIILKKVYNTSIQFSVSAFHPTIRYTSPQWWCLSSLPPLTSFPKIILPGTWEQLRQNKFRIKQVPSLRFPATFKLHEPHLVNIHDREIVLFWDKRRERATSPHIGSYKPLSNTHTQTHIHWPTKSEKNTLWISQPINVYIWLQPKATRLVCLHKLVWEWRWFARWGERAITPPLLPRRCQK